MRVMEKVVSWGNMATKKKKGMWMQTLEEV